MVDNTEMVENLDRDNNFTYRASGSDDNKDVYVSITKSRASSDADKVIVCDSLPKMFALYMAVENFRRIINPYKEEKMHMFRTLPGFSNKSLQRIGFFDYDLEKGDCRWYHYDEKLDEFRDGDRHDARGKCEAIAREHSIFSYSRYLEPDLTMIITMRKPSPDSGNKTQLQIDYLDGFDCPLGEKSPALMLANSELTALHWAMYDFCRKKLGPNFRAKIWRRVGDSDKTCRVDFETVD